MIMISALVQALAVSPLCNCKRLNVYLNHNTFDTATVNNYNSTTLCWCFGYLIVIPWARVVCLIYTPEARGPQARGLRVYISGEPRVHMV